jgi:hypothetical protein
LEILEIFRFRNGVYITDGEDHSGVDDDVNETVMRVGGCDELETDGVSGPGGLVNATDLECV